VPGSYELINYSIRPAKAIERKMLCEAFRRLSEFGSLEAVRYVGFGSTYFSDFAIFHKSLGIRHMISIEKDVANGGRFEFNRPFRCIEMRLGHSNAVLPTLAWNTRNVAWLDYDDRLDVQALADIRFLSMSVTPGSALIVSVNAHPDDYDEAHPRLPQLVERVGEEKVPNGIAEGDLAGWGTAAISRRIITNEIRETLIARNGALAAENQILYKQLFYFQYADGAKMVTAGGLFYERGQTPIVAKCDFEALPFIRTDQRPRCRPCMIEVPSLTYKEIRRLNTQLPRTQRSRLTSPKVAARDLKKYEAIYRYFPHFAETEI
jgi:hypothetical protein